MNIKDIIKNINQKNFSLKKEDPKTLMIICNDNISQDKLYIQLKFFYPDIDILKLYSKDNLPYEKSYSSIKIESSRIEILHKIKYSKNNKIVILSKESLFNKYDKDYTISNNFIKISIGDEITFEALLNSIRSLGYIKEEEIFDYGQYSTKGGNIIIRTYKHEYVISFSWNKIEKIKYKDVVKDKNHYIAKDNLNNIEYFELYKVEENQINQDSYEIFSRNFHKAFGQDMPHNPFINAFEQEKRLLEFDSLSSLFIKNSSTIFDFVKPNYIFEEEGSEAKLKEYFDYINVRYQNFLENNSSLFILKPSLQYYEYEEIIKKKNEYENLHITKENQPAQNDFEIIIQNKKLNHISSVKEREEIIIKYILSKLDKKVIIACHSLSSSEKVIKILKNSNLKYGVINFLKDAGNGFVNIANIEINILIESDLSIIIPCNIITGEQKQNENIDPGKKYKDIIIDLDTLGSGSLIVHNNHGIGKYLGVEKLSIKGHFRDLIKLEYQGSDKLYIPVENFDLIHPYEGDEALELDKLGSLEWQRRKSRIKKKISIIAKQLMEVAARRKLHIKEPCLINEDNYYKFAKNFPYPETNDQIKAIEDIKADMLSNTPMDRLLCGDVGFGKTEVAFRAAFWAVDSTPKMQVAVIVPTTILCKQHYYSFKERFRGFDINISQISRLVKRSEIAKIKNELSIGKIDILIGTSALFNSSVKFHNLGLLIIDEEQNFGVLQKEFLKKYGGNINVLYMSATPIPRTLQMSLLGIQDLSILSTPPIGRLPVKAQIIDKNEMTVIKDALLRESKRGGRSFFVVPRIENIKFVEEYLTSHLKELDFKVAHGGMNSSDIENIMQKFYEGAFDILISTSIIGAGIDITSANTMVIYKPELFGLSQLYQLRGRIGRGKMQGYLYLLPSSSFKNNNPSIHRLNLLIGFDKLGSGFAASSHDMDARGFGNLIGKEQSGKIKEVGHELYQDMLKKEIEFLSGNSSDLKKDIAPEINIGIPFYIPDDFINDEQERLRIYRHLAEIKSKEDLTSYKDFIIDKYGLVKEELSNLFEVIEIKIMCIELGIKKLDLGPKALSINFIENEQSLNLLFSLVQKYPTTMKVKPPSTIIYKGLDHDGFLLISLKDFLYNILQIYSNK